MEELRQKARAAKTCRHQRPVPVGWLSEPVQSRPVAVQKTLRSAPAAHRGGPTLQKPQYSRKLRHRTPKRGRPAPTGPAEHHSPQVSQRKERWETRPLVPTWHTPEQRGACETASDRAVARNFGATARGDASRASAERARAADTPRAPSTRGGTPGAGGGRRGSLVNPYGGECGRGGGDTAEPSSCRDGHISPPPEKKGKSSAKK